MHPPRVIQKLAAIRVEVPQPAETADFLEASLEFRRWQGEDGVEHVATEGGYGLAPPARELTLLPGPEVRVASVVFDVADESALTTIFERLESLGTHARSLDDDGVGGPGLGFEQPNGVPIECRIARTDERKTAPVPPSHVRPRRLGHVNLKMPDPPRACEFFCDVLGFRLTEQLGEMLYFVRVNSDHHNVAFRPADAANVHHIAFELSGWDALRVVCDHLTAHGYQIEYGPGRHRPGHQLFVYVGDPTSGLRLELFADMAHIDDEDTYQPIRHDSPRSSSINVWGPAPPETFLQ